MPKRYCHDILHIFKFYEVHNVTLSHVCQNPVNTELQLQGQPHSW